MAGSVLSTSHGVWHARTIIVLKVRELRFGGFINGEPILQVRNLRLGELKELTQS